MTLSRVDDSNDSVVCTYSQQTISRRRSENVRHIPTASDGIVCSAPIQMMNNNLPGEQPRCNSPYR